MSLVSNFTSLLTNTQRISNSEAGMFKTSNRMMNRVAQAGNPNVSLTQLHNQEKQDMFRLMNFDLFRKIAIARAESAEKLLKENAKKGFNILA
ncbi:MAG TPA: hypothetical protein P5556_04025 [Candidatus Gastranaerophilales bacterium]|nr:hypothetical protein [Candidatus Gastranaerophilales bacterium]